MASRLKPKQFAFAASDEAAPLLPAGEDNLWVRQFVVYSVTGSQAAYLGDADVTDADGLPVLGQSAFGLDPNRALTGKPAQMNLAEFWVVCATGESADLRVYCLVEEEEAAE